MPMQHAPAWLAVLAVGAGLLTGAYVVAVADAITGRLVAGAPLQPLRAFEQPFARSALWLSQQRISTERPDAPAWAVAIAVYAGVAAAATTVVPLAPTWVVADFRAGIVLWGAAEALAIVAVFLRGWSPNSLFPLIGGYRFVAQALSYELVSMFVLIAAALPAESLAVTRIVEAQAGLWNVVKQPLGLPLWIIVALGISFWGPLALPDGEDLSGGTAAEASGVERLLWQVARGAMLTAFAAMGAATFLGGWLGPWLPGPAWMLLKTLALLVLFVTCGHLFARFRPERFVLWTWTVLLPLAFVDLLIAGIGSLPYGVPGGMGL